ncbi:MAG: sugar transporter, partial [Pseudomonadota bacterium]|nr:sugar transporter [Pseudomonadota bacterium]
ARQDAIRYAAADLEDALARLLRARQEMTSFRTRTQIVDLEADLQARMGVMGNLQQTLAQELIAFDELQQSTRSTDPRLTQAQRRIEVIRSRIAEERAGIAATEVLGTGEDYPTLMAEFEGLLVQREFAESSYRAALTAYDAAQTNAVRQSRYLATYIPPTLAESPQYPRRNMIIGTAFLLLILGWGILVLVYYSIRDRG